MSRLGLVSAAIISSLAFSSRWVAPAYSWQTHPSSPGGKPTNAAAMKRQAKKRRNRK